MARGAKRKLPSRSYRDRFNGADPAVKEIIDRAIKAEIPFNQLGTKSGIAASCIYMWHERSPSIGNVRSVLNTLGLDLAVVPMKEDSTNE